MCKVQCRFALKYRLLKVFLTIAFALMAVPSLAGSTNTLKFMGKDFLLVEDASGMLLIQSGQIKLNGAVSKEYGHFSVWVFRADNLHELKVIVGEPRLRIIGYEDGEDAGTSATPIAASPDGKLLAIDYGTGPGERGLEIRDLSGKKLFSDGYLARRKIEPKWVGMKLEYVCLTSLHIDTSSETKKCADVGAAWKAEWCAFDGFTQKRNKLSRASTIECTN